MICRHCGLEIESRELESVTVWYSVDESPLGFRYFCENGSPEPGQHEPLSETFEEIFAILRHIEVDLR